MVIYDFGYSMELCSENVLILDEDRVRNKRGKSFSNEHHLWLIYELGNDQLLIA